MDIIKAIERVRAKAGMFTLDEFKADWEQPWIVPRGIEIVSEACRRLLEDLTIGHPGIPWAKIAAIGNIMRHEFLQISPPIIWEIVRDHLPHVDKVGRDEPAAAQQLERDRGC